MSITWLAIGYSIAFTETGDYFGNLRIHEWTHNIACFGRLIGSEKHRGQGYGKLMVELAKSLIFDFKKYDIIIAGNNSGDLASSNSKIKSGFKKMDQVAKDALKLKFNKKGEYFMLNRSDYLKNIRIG